MRLFLLFFFLKRCAWFTIALPLNPSDLFGNPSFPSSLPLLGQVRLTLKGYAFVDFTSHAAAARAIESMHDKRIKV